MTFSGNRAGVGGGPNIENFSSVCNFLRFARVRSRNTT
jgi:hypothetical protein